MEFRGGGINFFLLWIHLSSGFVPWTSLVKENRHLVILVEGKAFLVLFLIPLDGLGIPLKGLFEPTKSLENHSCEKLS